MQEQLHRTTLDLRRHELTAFHNTELPLIAATRRDLARMIAAARCHELIEAARIQLMHLLANGKTNQP